MAAVSRIAALVVSILLSAVFGSLALVGLLFRFLQNPLTFFKKVDRKRPTVLTENWNHEYVTLNNGMKFHYVAEGSRSQPMLLLLHGFPEFWFSWRHQIKEFAKSYYVVAVDMRGYGDTDKPQSVDNYGVNTLVGDMREFIAAVGYSSVTLACHDWGGVIGWQVMLQHPELVDKAVVLNCPHPSAFRKYLYSTPKQLLKSWYMFFFQLPFFPEMFLRCHDLQMFDEMFGSRKNPKHWLHPESAPAEVIEAYKFNYGQPGALTAPINYYRAAFTRRAEALREKGSNNRVALPLLIIWGTADLALSTELADLSAQYCDNVEVAYMEGASHFVHEDVPDQVNAAMWRFLKGES